MSERERKREEIFSVGGEQGKKIVDFLRKGLMLPGGITKMRLELCEDGLMCVDYSFIPPQPQNIGIREYALAADGQVIDATCL